MMETSGWSSGCGGYVFRNREGRISVAIGLADKRLSPALDRICIAKVVSLAFGIGAVKKMPSPGPEGRFKNAYLLNIVQQCDERNSTFVEVAACITGNANGQNFSP